MELTRKRMVKAILALPPEEQRLLLEELARFQIGVPSSHHTSTPLAPTADERLEAKSARQRERFTQKDARGRERQAAKMQAAEQRVIGRQVKEARRLAAAITSREDHPDSIRGRESELLRQRAIEAANRAEEAAMCLTKQIIDRDAAHEVGRAAKEAFERALRDLEELRRSYYLSGAEKKIDLRSIPGFAEAAALVLAEGRTYLDYDRLYTIWQSVTAGPVDAPVAEIGTYRGGSARFIAECLRRAGRSPRFFVCDTFGGSGHRDADRALTSPEGVAAYLQSYPNLEIVVGDIRATVTRLPSDARFGFVHVDVDWYAPTEACLSFFACRLAPGAILVLDDYGFLTCPGAKQAADEYIANHPEFQLLHLLTGQAVIYRR